MHEIHDSIKNYTMVDYERLKNLASIIDIIKNDSIDGEFIECGSWKCGTLGFMSLYSKKINHKCNIKGFDSFEGMPAPGDFDGNDASSWTGKLVVTINEGYENLQKMNVNDVRLYKGFFEETLAANKKEIGKISLLRIDCDWYSSTKTCLDELYELVVPGGFVIIDDYGHWKGCQKAVDEFREKNCITNPLHKTNYTEHWWRK